MEKQKNKSLPVKMIFGLYFVFMVIMYTFFDDGGIATKTGLDLLFIPIPSLVIASIFTLITCFGIYILRFFGRKMPRL